MLEISKDKARLQLDIIHNFLTHSYWAKGRSLEAVKVSIEHSICFGMYLNGDQVGFARVATDCIVFAYIMDVFVLPEHRGKGYGKRLIEAVHTDAQLVNCKGWMLKTADAHDLYKQVGYRALKYPEKVMERFIE